MATTNGPRGSYAKTEQFRAVVLDAALRILAERGFDATTLQLISDEVGRSKAGVLHHFGSRDDLLLEILRHRDAVNRGDFPPDPDGGFSASVALVDHNATVPGLIAMFTVVSALAASDTSTTSRRAYFVARYIRSREAFTTRFARAQESGAIRDDVKASVIATLMLATMDGLQTQWLLDPTIDMTAHLREFLHLLSPPIVPGT